MFQFKIYTRLIFMFYVRKDSKFIFVIRGYLPVLAPFLKWHFFPHWSAWAKLKEKINYVTNQMVIEAWSTCGFSIPLCSFFNLSVDITLSNFLQLYIRLEINKCDFPKFVILHDYFVDFFFSFFKPEIKSPFFKIFFKLKFIYFNWRLITL